MQPSVVPFQSKQHREISLTRRTETGRVVKEMNFQLGHKTAPRSPKWVPGVPLPSVESCLECVPRPTGWRDFSSLITCGWFYFKSGDGETLGGVYEQIGLLSALFAIIVQGMLGAAKDIAHHDWRGLSVLFCGLSMFLLISSAFFSLVHFVFSRKMMLDSQVTVFNMLYASAHIQFFSPIRFLQYGMFSGCVGGVMWMFGFLEVHYSVPFFVIFIVLAVMTLVAFCLFLHAGIGVLEAEPLRTGEQASLDWKAIKVLLDYYEEDCGSEFMSPEGFLSFCGECLLKPGCDPSELCEFSYVTKLRMETMIAKRFQDLADWQSFVEEVGGLPLPSISAGSLPSPFEQDRRVSLSPNPLTLNFSTAGSSAESLETDAMKSKLNQLKEKVGSMSTLPPTSVISPLKPSPRMSPGIPTIQESKTQELLAEEQDAEQGSKKPQGSKLEALKKKHKKPAQKAADEEAQAAGLLVQAANGSPEDDLTPGYSPQDVILGNTTDVSER